MRPMRKIDENSPDRGALFLAELLFRAGTHANWFAYPALSLPEEPVRSYAVFRHAVNSLTIVLLVVLVLVLLLTPLPSIAGGSGFNVVVVANGNSPNSLALANYYCQRRGIPSLNVLRISWSGGNTSWTRSQFESVLLNPLLAMIVSRGLSGQIDYVALAMDIPFVVSDSSGANSTTSALFYGFKGLIGKDLLDVTNSYAASESIFRLTHPSTAPGYSFLATMITAGSLDLAKRLVDQGVASDGTSPGQSVVLAKSSDPLRNQRYWTFDNAVFNARVGGPCLIERTNSDSPWGQTNLLGYQTGLANFGLSPGSFIPGAMADSMTSFGGVIFGPNGQTSLLSFIHAGASGSYGTVTEPQSVRDKFPDPQNYFFQSRGFSLAECYYQSVFNPYQGLVVGEPLAAPFRRLATGNWDGLPPNAVLAGATNLGLRFVSGEGKVEMQRVDLFVDGLFLETLTNLPPQSGDQLSLVLNGQTIYHNVPPGATLRSLAIGLADALNEPWTTNLTGVVAKARGDRIELQSLSAPAEPGTFEFVHSGATNAPIWYYRAARLLPTRPANLTAMGLNGSRGFSIRVDAPPGAPFSIQASANLVDWVTIHARPSGGLVDFTDPFAKYHPRRFYRVASLDEVSATPWLNALGHQGGGFQLYVESATGRSYLIEASTNLVTWTAIATNLAGGPMEFLDANAGKYLRRYYRLLSEPSLFGPSLKATGRGEGGGFKVVIDSADASPYIVQASADLVHWVDVATNAAGGNLNFFDVDPGYFARRFYRTLGLPLSSAPFTRLVKQTASGANVVLVEDGSSAAVVLMASTNLETWQPIVTNYSRGPSHVEIASVPSVGGQPSTFLRASRGTFLDSAAFGVRSIAINGILRPGVMLQLQVEKTNAILSSISVTNGLLDGTIFQLAQQLTNAVNSAADLQGADGLVVEDLAPGFQGAATFNLRARSPGFAAAGIHVSLLNPGGTLTGLMNDVDLRQNISDLRARNHLYLTAGSTELRLQFPLDTTLLENGWHELTAVAYEGNHVQTQTHCSVPVIISNTAFSATLSIPDAGPSASVLATFHPQVTTTGSAAISEIRLFSTGGFVASVTNQSHASFSMAGLSLGVGSHPFYAVAMTTNGSSFRTAVTRLQLYP